MFMENLKKKKLFRNVYLKWLNEWHLCLIEIRCAMLLIIMNHLNASIFTALSPSTFFSPDFNWCGEIISNEQIWSGIPRHGMSKKIIQDTWIFYELNSFSCTSLIQTNMKLFLEQTLKVCSAYACINFRATTKKCTFSSNEKKIPTSMDSICHSNAICVCSVRNYSKLLI